MILSKYDELMEKITVTEDMRNRILTNIQREKTHPVSSFRRYARFFAVAACFALFLIGTVTIRLATHHPADNEEEYLSYGNPITEASSIDELEALVGFSISDIPSLAKSAQAITYCASDSELAEIQYSLGAQTVSYRKAPKADDISGIYTTYGHTDEITLGSVSVTVKGDDDTTFQLALWTDGDYSYSLYFETAITQSEMERVLDEIIVD